MSDVIFLFLRRLRAPLTILIVVYSVAILGMTLVPGVDPEGNPWRMSFFHAFYFVSFMGSTIGFGEIPYDFTDSQRLWVSICIYASVISWLYAIGNVLRLFQDTSFQHAVASRAFRKSVDRISQHFYIICGYGDTGRLLTRGLADLDILCVVVDLKPESAGSIELNELSPLPITLCGDITDPQTLESAGINHPYCQGVIAVTQNDHTNLEIAVAAKLINSKVKVICRSESEDETRNMESFGTDVVINPFKTFAKRLSLLTHDHTKHRLQGWFVNQHSKELINGEIAENGLPGGRWIICGYGRLGRSIVSIIKRGNIEVVIVDPNIDQDELNTHKTILGRGTEADTLYEAGIEQATVIVAASDDDANNLSILITAHALNAQIYSIGRVNIEAKHSLYLQAHCDYIMRRSQLVSNEVLTLISRPLVSHFLDEVTSLGEKQTELLIDEIEVVGQAQSPVTWRLILSQEHSPALLQILSEGHILKIKDVVDCLVLNENKARVSGSEIPLLLNTYNAITESSATATSDRTLVRLPDPEQTLKAGDQLLICHARDRLCRAQLMACDYEKVDSRIGGNPHFIPLRRWLHRKARSAVLEQRDLDINTTNKS